MAEKKKFCLWRNVKGVLLVTLIGTTISLLFTGFSNITWNHVLYSVLYSFLIGASLWMGNVSIDPTLERIFRNHPLTPGRKLIYSLATMMLVSSIIIIFVNWFYFDMIQRTDFWAYVGRGGGLLIMIIEIVTVVIIALVLYTDEFFRSWREAVRNEESLKREKLALQYESLKNQVNPHFLFNSLNSLSGLIGKDDEKATRFVKQLSDIYRYVLEHKDREVVSVGTEMQFVANYINLMKIRFGDNLIVNINIDAVIQKKLIPLSIQMLVENAIKHNIVSQEKPLHIDIEMDGKDHLLVRNNLQKKSSILKEESNEWEKHGLMNIKSRYEYLSGNNFVVNGSTEEPFPEKLNDSFIVKVPLI
jgi:sensor histidine kinase YesM